MMSMRLVHVLLSCSPLLSMLLTSGTPVRGTTACKFCGIDTAHTAHTFDLSALPNSTFTLHDAAGTGTYQVASPCGCAAIAITARGMKCTCMTQGGARGLGDIDAEVTVTPGSGGFNVTVAGGDNDPPMPHGRNAVYHFVCDKDVPLSHQPDPTVTEQPPGFYNVVWRHPSACTSSPTPTTCPPPPPVPPLPPPPPPPPPPIPCAGGSEPCLPAWKPTWHMKNSTVLYTCNNSGMHDVHHANQFGIVVYDWSNAKAIWANAHPMSSEELITKQAEMVYAADPGVPGFAPRVWAYRNTIKALNWYSSVREKLDDPKYSSWFVKFKGFSDSPYPGGDIAKPRNGSYHVPACDWYDNGTSPRCSGFYHDQEQTPEHPGGGKPYPVDGDCIEQCDCGPVNPCGEYIFNHSGAEVDGRTFRDWFINENPVTGEKQVIGLGWLDDSMSLAGPSEEDKNYIADTGASPASMMAQTAAYRESMYQLVKKVVPMGGFWWQLMDGSGVKVNPTGGWNNGQNKSVTPAACKAALDKVCVGANASATPSSWNRMQMYNVPNGGQGVTTQGFTDYTAEFLLTRGPYAILGYSWCGCTNGNEMRPRAKEWDEDFGEPVGVCKETSPGIYEREWTKASVEWDCASGHGKISPK